MRLLQDCVLRGAERWPEEVAMVGEDGRRISYEELDRISSQLAHGLREAGCGAGDRVGLLSQKSPEAITAMVGVLKAGAIYVPIDPSSPPARGARILDACEPWGILADAASAGRLDELLDLAEGAAPRIGSLEASPLEGERYRSVLDRTDLEGLAAHPPPRAASPDDPAHILFTSGSTGMPKGVMVTHRNVVTFVEWGVRYFGIAPGDRLSGHSPLHFDLSTFDIYGSFAAGAELHLVPPQLNLLPKKLVAFLRERELNQWFSVPSVLRLLVSQGAVEDGDFPALRRLLWCGEVLPTPVLVQLMKRLPHVAFTNLYGPTEATIASSYHTVPACPADEREPVPIGVACAGEELRVLDDDLEECAEGETGDLFIGGVGLTAGYWRDPEKTAAVFLTDPRDPARRIYKTGDLARWGPDGLVHFLGRADTQIKSRGYRIELGEIEAALHALGCLEECAVVAIPTDGFEGNRICCAYVPRGEGSLPPARLRKQVAELLPPYMLPAAWKELPMLPKNANGKIDRPALKEAFEQGRAQGRPARPEPPSTKLWPIEAEDAPTALRWLADEENWQWLDFGNGMQVVPAPMLHLMRQRDTHCLRFFGGEDTGPIGIVALSDIVPSKGTATLWYLLGEKDHGGRGHTTRAVQGLLDHAFGPLGLHAIHAWAVVENTPSIRVLEKCGFRRIGRQRGCHLLGDRRTDRLLFDLLSDDPQETR